MPLESDILRRSHALLTRAMELEPSARRAFVHSECAEDSALLKRLLEMLDAADRSDRFLEQPALDFDESPQIPDAVGNYLIVGVLGTGGMATVYEAIQDFPKRRVALKVMRQGMTHSEAYLRFRFETETLARLRHPGIAQIYEAGAAQLGQPVPSPFFAMELIPDAVPITVYADQHRLTLHARLRMFASVCDAVHHGHQQGVIHRDLKPGNVLVDSEGHAKVIDFGVARTTDVGAESLTEAMGVPKLIGTLQYMSPEQCGIPGGIDIRSDVYSLGVMLYQLVCGRLPYDMKGKALPAAVETIVHKPPSRLPLAPSGEHRDLEAIIFKAIEKDRECRYNSAAALASDLRHLLSHQPIEARPPGVVDQFRLFARRHGTLVALGLATVTSVVLIAGISTIFAVRLTDEVSRRSVAEQQARKERDDARWRTYTAQIAGALSAMNAGEFRQMRTRLSETANHPRGWEWGLLSRLSETSIRTIAAHDDMIMDMAVDPGASRIATAGSDGAVRLWDAQTGASIARSEGLPGSRVFSVTFSSDGRNVITGDAAGMLRSLDGSTLEENGVLATTTGEIRSVVALPEIRGAAALDNGTAIVWTPAGVIAFPDDQPGGVNGLTVSTDGTLLATYNTLGAVWIRRTTDFSVLQRFQFPGYVNQARFSHDGRWIAAAGASTSVFVWNVQDGSLERELQGTAGVTTVRSLAFSNNGEMLAVGQTHRGILVFSVADGRVLTELGGHYEAVSSLAFHPDDSVLTSASWDGTIRTWLTNEFSHLAGTITLQGHEDFVLAVQFSPDGSMIASASRDGSLRLWDPDLGQPFARLQPGNKSLTALTFSADGRQIATVGAGDAVVVSDTLSGAVLAELAGDKGGSATVAFDPSGQRLAAGGQDGIVRVWGLVDHHEQLALQGHTARVNSVAFSPDGSVIASGSRDRTVRLWNAHTGAELAMFDDHRSDVFAVLFSKDGRRLYSGSRDQTVRAWDIKTRTLLATLSGHGQYVTCLALSPDGDRLAAGSWFGEIVLFDVPTLDLIASFRAHSSAIRGIAFSPDGRFLASASYDSTVRLFDSATREVAERTRSHSAAAQATARRVITPILESTGRNGVLKQLGEASSDVVRDPWARKESLRALYPPENP